jgi:mitochondrial import inner membrane translocase subunit TIM8
MAFENHEQDLTASMDADLQDFIQVQQQKAQLQSSAHKLTDMCWDRCIGDRPGQRLESKTEACLTNCVERFIDASMFLVTRLQKNLQGHS